MLDAVGYAATQIVAAADWQDGIQELLDRLGHATEVSRVTLFEVHDLPAGHADPPRCGSERDALPPGQLHRHRRQDPLARLWLRPDIQAWGKRLADCELIVSHHVVGNHELPSPSKDLFFEMPSTPLLGGVRQWGGGTSAATERQVLAG